MAGNRPSAEHNEFVMNTADQAREAGGISSATVLTAIASFAALVFSGISLYQTVLKRSHVRLFVPDTLSYTRDPNGSFEVLALPVTMINSGARDGVISSLKLTVTNEAGVARTFNATYFAEPGYFSTKEDYAAGQSRPKRPFAPVTITGRSGQSSTVLFYPKTFDKQRVVKAGGEFRFKLDWQALAVDPIPLLDQFDTAKNETLTFSATLPPVPQYFDGAMMTGKSARMFVTVQ